MKICKLKPLVIVMATCGFLFFGSIVSAGAQPVEEVDKEVKGALMNEDWEKVARLLDDVTTEHPSPVLRMIKGHACLATNRNNDASCLFQSVVSAEKLAQWKQWTEALARQHQENAVTSYFLGDAQARLRQWEHSLATLTLALKSHPKNAILFNARGVVQAAQRKWDYALLDFEEAVAAQASLADAHASRGAMYIQKRDGAEGALKSFKRALDLSPDFALALSGKACAEFALGFIDEAKGDFEAAVSKSSCLQKVIGENIAMILRHIEGERDLQVAKLSDKEAGFLLEKSVNEYMKKPSKQNYDKLAGAFPYASPNEQGKARTTLSTWLGQFPDKLPVYKEHNTNYANKTQPGGKWDKIYTDLGALNSGLSAGLSAGMAARGGKGKLAVDASLSGSLSQSAKPFADLMKETNAQRWAANNKLGEAASIAERHNLGIPGAMKLPTTGQGGIKIDMSAAHLDTGDWPFVANYGLFYPIDAR